MSPEIDVIFVVFQKRNGLKRGFKIELPSTFMGSHFSDI